MITENKLIKLITKSLKISSDEITINSKVNEIEEWDSLGHVTIMFAIDKETKGKASKIVALNEAQSIKGIYTLLKKNNLAD
tara:strand:- start:133 stop:375 length:243 start_codon:yes stop_codon:yes gene_type:complete